MEFLNVIKLSTDFQLDHQQVTKGSDGISIVDTYGITAGALIVIIIITLLIMKRRAALRIDEV